MDTKYIIINEFKEVSKVDLEDIITNKILRVIVSSENIGLKK